MTKTSFFIPVVGAELGGFHRSGEGWGSAAPVAVLSSHREHVLGGRPKWMNVWMNEWINKWLIQWMNGWIYERMNIWKDEYMNRWIYEWINVWISEWMNEWMNA